MSPAPALTDQSTKDMHFVNSVPIPVLPTIPILHININASRAFILIFVNNWNFNGGAGIEGANCTKVMKVLVVEDDEKLLAFVESGLKAEGFALDTSDHGDEAYALATTRSYDAIVLDIMLPGRDGLSILRNLRDKGIETPVIILTARGSLNERLDGLNLGADDYMAKPFYVEELAARLRVVARRAGDLSKSILSNGDLSLNLLTREARVGDVRIELTAREFALLTYLVRSPGRVYSRAQICEHVWNYHFDPATNIVDVYIQKLRKKLDVGGSGSIIETVRGVGYRARRDPT